MQAFFDDAPLNDEPVSAAEDAAVAEAPPQGELVRLGREEWRLRIGDWRLRCEPDAERQPPPIRSNARLTELLVLGGAPDQPRARGGVPGAEK